METDKQITPDMKRQFTKLFGCPSNFQFVYILVYDMNNIPKKGFR